MARVIRYLENGEYKYATVRDIGELEKLQTIAKTDIVSAINELFNGGGMGGKLPDGLEERLIELEESETSLTQEQANLKLAQEEAELNRQQMIEDLGEVEDYLDQVKLELDEDVADVRAKHSALQEEKDLLQEQVNVEKERLDGIATEMTTKLDSEKYNQDYKSLTDVISEKAGLEDLANEKAEIISRIDTDIASQQVEIDTAKTNITNLQTKTGNLETSLTEKANATELTKQTKELEEKITTGLSNMDGKVETVETRITEAEGNINLKANSENVYTKQEMNNELGKKIDNTIYEQKMSEIDIKTDGITQTVSSLEGRMSTTEGELTSIESNISSIDQKADSIQLEVSGINKKVGSQGETISSHTTSLGLIEEGIKFKAEAKDVYTKTDVDTKLGSKVDSTIYQEKIAEIDITTSGITQKVGSIEGKVATAEGGISTLKSDVSTIKQTQEGIALEVEGINTNVTNQGKTISSHSSSITALQDEITSKVEATDVYTKNAVDTKLGQKVESTTYNAKMTEIKQTTDGISQTVSNQTTKVDGIDGKVSEHTSKISNLTQNVDGITATVSAIEGDLDGVTGRMSSAESKITANETAINLRATKDEVDTLEGRVESAEAEIDVQAGQITQRVTKTEFEDSVGVNKWISSRYIITGTDLGAIAPTFSLITGKTASLVKEIADNSTLAIDSGNNQITHLFTNVRLDSAKTISLTVKYNSSLTILVNGASIYSNKGNSQTAVTVSLSLRAGWNTIEILHGLVSGQTPVLQLGVKLSSQVAKMTTTIGVGNKDETRMTNAETTIKQTQDAIELKAEQSVVDNLGNRVGTAESTLNVQAGQIASKVENSTFNNYTKRVENAESSITQLSKSIELKVDSEDFDTLNQRVTTQGASITTLNTSVGLKANQSVVDTLNQKVTDNTAQLLVQAGQIESKVAQTDFDKVSGRVTSAETRITQTEKDITSKASASDVYTKTEADGRITTNVNNAKSEIKQTTDGISQTVSGLSSTVSGHTSSINSHSTSITNMNKAISLKAEANNVYTKTETDGKVSTAVSNAKAEILLTTDRITQKVTAVENSQLSSTDVNNAISKAKSDNFGYRYYEKVIVYGDSIDKYYPVIIKGGNQSVKRDILIQRGYSEQAPSGWNPDMPVHHGGLTVKIKTNFGGWGGANYSWEVHELEEMYSNTFAGATNTGNQTMFAVFLRGGGTTGAVYHIYSDQPLDSNLYSPDPIPASPQIAYNKDLIFKSGDYLAYAPESRTYTQSVIDEIAKRNFIKLSQNLDTRMSTAETSITQTKSDITFLAKKTDVYTKAEADGKISSSVNSAKAEIKQTTDSISQTVSSINSTVSGHTSSINSHSSSITSMNTSISLKANANNVYTKTEADGKISTAITDAKADIKITTDSITSKVSGLESTTGSLGTRMTSAESSINQTKTDITSKVSNTDYTGATVVSMINQTADSVKIMAKNIEFTAGSVVFNALGSDAQSKINTAVNNASSAVSTANTASTNASNAVSTANTANSNANTAKTNASTALTTAQNVQNAINDMSNDNKLVPMEKQQLKKEWATISAEKTPYEGLANTYGLATQKNAYVTAYNNLNTKLNGTGGYLLNLTTTTDLGTNGGANFRAVFDDYYDKKAQLIKAINETSRSLANEAKNTAGTANTNASNAVSTANTANSNATTAKTDASTAKTNASNAVTTANTANTNASTAKTNASNAVTTANTANSNASNAVTRVGQVESKINNAITTIDGNGVNVKNGSFTLEDDITTTRYNVAMLPNLIKDHSFELLKPNEASPNVKYNWMPVAKDSYNALESPWSFSGTPCVATYFAPDKPEAMPIFGDKAIAVDNNDFIKQIVAVAPSTTYTLSAYFKRQWNVVAGAKPQLEVWRIDALGKRVGSYIKIEKFAVVDPNYAVARHAMTFTTPSNLAVDEAIEIVIISDTEYWMQVDGVQLVEGSTPCLYNPEDSVWRAINGYYGVSTSRSKILWAGGAHMRDTDTIKLSVKLTECPNGIQLIWSDDGGNYDNNVTYIHKSFVENYPGQGIHHVLSFASALEEPSLLTKYVYVHDDKLVGNKNNYGSGRQNDTMLKKIIMY